MNGWYLDIDVVLCSFNNPLQGFLVSRSTLNYCTILECSLFGFSLSCCGRSGPRWSCTSLTREQVLKDQVRSSVMCTLGIQKLLHGCNSCIWGCVCSLFKLIEVHNKLFGFTDVRCNIIRCCVLILKLIMHPHNNESQLRP